MKKFSQGLFWGALFGGLAGLLNAPRSGQETRQYLKEYLDQTTADVNDVRYKVDNLSHAIQRLTQEGLGNLKEAQDEIQYAVNQFTRETEPRIQRIQDRVQNLQSEIKENLEDN